MVLLERPHCDNAPDRFHSRPVESRIKEQSPTTRHVEIGSLDPPHRELSACGDHRHDEEELNAFEVENRLSGCAELWPSLGAEPEETEEETSPDSLAEGLQKIGEAEDDLESGAQVSAFEGAWSAALDALKAVYERLDWPLPSTPRRHSLSECRYPQTLSRSSRA